MIKVKGKGVIIDGPFIFKDDDIDMIINFGKQKPIQLIGMNKDIKEVMKTLHKGDNIRFEGLLKSTDPGFYHILIKSIAKIRKHEFKIKKGKKK